MTPGMRRIFSRLSICSSAVSSFRVPSRSRNSMRRPLMPGPHAVQQRIVLLRACPPRRAASAAAPGCARRSRTIRSAGHAVAHEALGIAAIDQQEIGVARPDLVDQRRGRKAAAQVFALRQQALEPRLRGGKLRGLQGAQGRLDGRLRQGVGRDDPLRQLNQLRVREQRADPRAGQRVRLGQRAQDRQRREAAPASGVRLARARPFDVGLVDHDDGLAVERRADALRGRRRRAGWRWDCWASTDTPA